MKQYTSPCPLRPLTSKLEGFLKYTSNTDSSGIMQYTAWPLLTPKGLYPTSVKKSPLPTYPTVLSAFYPGSLFLPGCDRMRSFFTVSSGRPHIRPRLRPDRIVTERMEISTPGHCLKPGRHKLRYASARHDSADDTG